MSHATRHAKRFAACAANATNPKRRKMFERIAKQWAAYALENDSQRADRIEREHQEYVAKQETKRLARIAADVERKARAGAWAMQQANRYADETPAQRTARFAEETRLWQEHKTARAALLSKRKKKGTTLDRERQEARAVKQREREAKQEAKRAAARKPSLKQLNHEAHQRRLDRAAARNVSALPPLPLPPLPAPAAPALPPLPYGLPLPPLPY